MFIPKHLLFFSWGNRTSSQVEKQGLLSLRPREISRFTSAYDSVVSSPTVFIYTSETVCAPCCEGHEPGAGLQLHTKRADACPKCTHLDTLVVRVVSAESHSRCPLRELLQSHVIRHTLKRLHDQLQNIR